MIIELSRSQSETLDRHLRLPANRHVLACSRKSDRHALKLPRVSVVRRLEELIKHGYVERVGNAYRVTDKVNIPELQKKLQRRIDMVAETAKRLAELNAGSRPAAILLRPSTDRWCFTRHMA